jgi:large subunit ribosomal protein L23
MLKAPRITEKSFALAKDGLYTFVVSDSMTKPQILKLITSKFNVDVVSVKTINIKGKRRQQRSRKGSYTTVGYKKALVQVKKGQKIALFETAVAPQEEVVVTSGEGEPIKTKVKETKSLKGTKVKVERADDTKDKKGAK